MSFRIDKQTIDDLSIFGKNGTHSVYTIFNVTKTRGGAKILEEMFLYPLSDEYKINQRGKIIRYFQNNQISFPFRYEIFDAIEFYLSNTDSRSKLVSEEDTLQRKLRNYMGTDTEYEQLHKGVLGIIELLNTSQEFLRQLDSIGIEEEYQENYQEIQAILDLPPLKWFPTERKTKKIPYAKMVSYDQVLRYSSREQLNKLLYLVYLMDVYTSVAQVAKERNFSFAQASPPGKNILHMEEMYHPLLPHPVANTITVDEGSNLIFLTGANMAGKSTFMKSFGITLFLAHMGFPVPAKNMKFTVQNGMFTTINLPDNLNMGYSHFYAEVLRVKKVAESVKRSQNLIVIFDELFRGTNVKDAYDATVAVTEAFARNRNCTFIISTHIIEAGETLKRKCDNINFIYLPTEMQGSVPKYTYKIKPGITNDRHGMMIIHNEKIIDTITDGKPKPVDHEGQGMRFIVDKQTLDDLNLLGRYKNNSIFSLYDHMVTRGGGILLENMFQQPLTAAAAINQRKTIFSFFTREELTFPFSKEEFKAVEFYTASAESKFQLVAILNTTRRKLMQLVASEKEYVLLQNGLLATIHLLSKLEKFMQELLPRTNASPYREVVEHTLSLLHGKQLKQILDRNTSCPLSFMEMLRYDYLVRHSSRRTIQKLMHILHELDVNITVGRIARAHGFTYATAREDSLTSIDLKGVYHPCIPKATANDICLLPQSNVLFLTGANMAGKSTLMKSFGIAIYMAHMGFPVAAASMTFTVQNGIYTSINVPDNLNMGYSHFYAEVLRVKKVAEEVSSGNQFVIIFDELFKGTNVKDAYDATVAVTEAFSTKEKCSFIVSTHIMEAGETLRERCPNMQFFYLPTLMQGNVPTYTYVLQQGITDDRHGMMIINNEHIIETIKGER